MEKGFLQRGRGGLGRAMLFLLPLVLIFLPHVSGAWRQVVQPQYIPKKEWAEQTITVPVYLWFVSTDPQGRDSRRTTETMITQQLQVLNTGFLQGSPEAKIKWNFQLTGMEGISGAGMCNEEDEKKIKSQYRKGGRETLNIYFLNLSGCPDANLGYASAPWVLEKQGVSQDGVVVNWETMPGGRAVNYNQGKTLIQLVGKWLGLLNVYAGGCSKEGDQVADTPASTKPTEGCPAPNTKDTCPKEEGFDAINNFMDDSYDACLLKFTPGQQQRMLENWNKYRKPDTSAPAPTRPVSG